MSGFDREVRKGERGRQPKFGNAYSSCERGIAWQIDPILQGSLNKPLEFIISDHHRQRQAGLILLGISEGHFDRRGVEDLITFLVEDFAVHLGDEELCLFPMLQQYCAPEDKIEYLLGRLLSAHRKDEKISEQAVVLLNQLLDGNNLTPDEHSIFRDLAAHLHEHFAFENSVLLPLARVRLDSAALAILSHMLKERRNSH